MSSDEVDFLQMCTMFEERLVNAQKEFDIFELLDESTENIQNDGLDEIPKNFHYIWTPGIRFSSELMFAVEEEMLYISNGKMSKEAEEAFTCYNKKCGGRVYLKSNGIAYKVAPHTVLHGSMYKSFMEMQCRHAMREQCKVAGASKTITEIYGDAVIM